MKKGNRRARSKRIAVVGGGTGSYTVLSGLKRYPVHLSAIVSMADDGGSTRVLREEFGVLPPGSVRPAMVALSHAEKPLADLFNYRFENGRGLAGHNFGNLFITALCQQLGSFEKALREAGRILQIKGEVIPSTLGNCRLFARLEDGTILEGETNIDIPKHNWRLKIQDLWLEPACRANPRALEALQKADLIVVGPGDLYSSVLPNFLPRGFKKTFRESDAKKVFVCNVMTKRGETTGFQTRDFVKEFEKYAGTGVLDCLVVNAKRPSKARIARYETEGAEAVKADPRSFEGGRLDILFQDLLRPRGLVRHDPDKLAKALVGLL